jgi:hypothetical protein
MNGFGFYGEKLRLDQDIPSRRHIALHNSLAHREHCHFLQYDFKQLPSPIGQTHSQVAGLIILICIGVSVTLSAPASTASWQNPSLRIQIIDVRLEFDDGLYPDRGGDVIVVHDLDRSRAHSLANSFRILNKTRTIALCLERI